MFFLIETTYPNSPDGELFFHVEKNTTSLIKFLEELDDIALQCNIERIRRIDNITEIKSSSEERKSSPEENEEERKAIKEFLSSPHLGSEGEVFDFIKPFVEAGKNWSDIARRVNKKGFTTIRGCKYYNTTIKDLYRRISGVSC